MRNVFKMSLRLLAVLAAIGAISTLFTPASRTDGPYISALSDLMAQSALAAPPTCNQRNCDTPFTCNQQSKKFNCKISPQGDCSAKLC